MEHYTEQNPISVQPCTLTRVKEMESENGKGAASSDTGETAVWCLYRWKPHSKKDWRHEEGVDTGGVFDYSYFSNNLSDTFLKGIQKNINCVCEIDANSSFWFSWSFTVISMHSSIQ